MKRIMGSKDMYKKSAKPAKDDVKEGPTEAEKTATAENGEVGSMPVHEDHMARHVLDRHHMMAKHEHEHAMHKEGDKGEMHGRHQAEMKAMHKRHEKEMAEGGRKDAMAKGEEQ